MTQDPQHDESFVGMTALYALGGLEEVDKKRFEQHLEVCRTCVDEINSFLPITQALVFTAPTQTPPDRLREKIVGTTPSIDPESSPPAPRVLEEVSIDKSRDTSSKSTEPVDGRRWMNFGFRATAIVCLIIAGGLGWYAAQNVNEVSNLRTELDDAMLRVRVADLDAASSRQLVEEMRGRADTLASPVITSVELKGQPGADNAFGRAFISTSRSVVITALNMPALPPGQIYQVWLVLPEDPVSVGVAQVDASGRIFESLAPSPNTEELLAVAVTREPDGGVETPSGNVLLLGKTSQ